MKNKIVDFDILVINLNARLKKKTIHTFLGL